MNEQQERNCLLRAEGYYRTGKLRAARDLLNRVKASNPNNPYANELLAYIARREGNAGYALELLRLATRHPLGSASAQYHFGGLLLERGEFTVAIAAFRESIRRGGPCFENLHDLGTALSHTGDWEGALEMYQNAERERSDVPELYFNMARVFDALHDPEAALKYYDRCLSLNSQNALAWSNRGVTLNDLKRYHDAIQSFQEASKLLPNETEPLWNEALTRLALGDYRHGWAKYEYRWQSPGYEGYRHADIPRLTSLSEVSGSRVLVWAEQGYGDTLQFCRFLPMLVEAGARVLFEVQSPLLRLMRQLPGIEVIPRGESLGGVDWQCPLLSLPHLFGTELGTIPPTIPNFKADQDLVSEWKRRLAFADDRPVVAVACAGRSGHRNDHNRSMSLGYFSPLADSYNIVVAQKDLRDADVDFSLHKESIKFLGPWISDFADTAAIVEISDVVVSVDTALAHLAGTLGKRACVLLPWAAEWRWLTDSADSPWYPGVRLIRQRTPGNWAGVIHELRQVLGDGGP